MCNYKPRDPPNRWTELTSELLVIREVQRLVDQLSVDYREVDIATKLRDLVEWDVTSLIERCRTYRAELETRLARRQQTARAAGRARGIRRGKSHAARSTARGMPTRSRESRHATGQAS